MSLSVSIDEVSLSGGLPQYTDVVIIGGGPAGLSLALELKKFGVDSVVLDHSRIEYPREAPVDVELPTQATLLLPETLDILQELGLINEVSLSGRPVDGALILLNGSVHVCKDKFEASPLTKFRNCVAIEQWKLEHFMTDKLKRLGVQVFRPYVVFRLIIKMAGDDASKTGDWSGTPQGGSSASSASASSHSSLLTGSTPEPRAGGVLAGGRSLDDYRVKVFVKKMDPLARRPVPDSTGQWIRARYVVGADGVRSMTRRALDIEMDILSPVHDYLVADVCISKWGTSILGENSGAVPAATLPAAAEAGTDPANKIYIIHSEQGSGLLIPFLKADHWRLMVQRKPSSDPPTGPASNIGFRKLEPPTNAEVIDILAQLIPDTVVDSVFWRIAYSADRRMAKSFVKERGIIIGDAARLDVPLWSGGINAALQDATSLGWRLALVIHNKLPHSILGTFNEERLLQSNLFLQHSADMTGILLNYPNIVTKSKIPFLNKFQHSLILPALQGIAHVPLAVANRY